MNDIGGFWFDFASPYDYFAVGEACAGPVCAVGATLESTRRQINNVVEFRIMDATGRTTRRKTSGLPAERRMTDILAAARAIFSEKGYDAALISDIAERAGVVDGSIYRFFANNTSFSSASSRAGTKR